MKKFFIISVLMCFCVCGYSQSDTLGVYANHDGKFEKIELNKFSGVKSNGIGASMISFGFAKMKAGFVFKGATSKHHFNGTAKIRMYFGRPELCTNMNTYMLCNNNTPDNFSIVKLEKKKNERRALYVTASILSCSTGAEEGNVEVICTKVGDHIYDLTISGEAGEYGLTYNGVGGNVAAYIFDFTID